VRISNAKARSRISRPNRNKPKTQLLRASARLRAVFAYGKTSSGYGFKRLLRDTGNCQ